MAGHELAVTCDPSENLSREQFIFIEAVYSIEHLFDTT